MLKYCFNIQLTQQIEIRFCFSLTIFIFIFFGFEWVTTNDWIEKYSNEEQWSYVIQSIFSLFIFSESLFASFHWKCIARTKQYTHIRVHILNALQFYFNFWFIEVFSSRYGVRQNQMKRLKEIENENETQSNCNRNH